MALILFGVGTILPVLLFSLWFFIHGSFGNFIERMVSWNIGYVVQVSFEKVSSINSLVSTVPNVFLSFIVILTGLIIVVLTPKRTNRLTAIMLFFSSFMSIFGAGIFYVHHSAQLLLAFFFSIIVIAQLFRGALLLITLSTFFSIILFSNYAVFIYAGGPASFLSLRHTPPAIKEISEKPYLHMIGYQPSFYFFYHKRSPDPFFIPFMLKMSLAKTSKENIDRHKALAKGLVKQTAFVAVEMNGNDISATQEYLQAFAEPFALKEKMRYQDGPARIVVYHSSLP